MLKTTLIVLVVAVIAILISAAVKPATYHVERSTTIAAAPEKISPLLNDFHNWDQWSPWAKLDPNMRVTLQRGACGTGSHLSMGGKQQSRQGPHGDPRG